MSGDLVSILLDAVGALVVVLDREHRVVRFNRACEELCGYKLDELRGAFLWERMLPAEDADALKIACEQVLGGRYPLGLEHSWVLREGGVRRTIAWTLRGLTDPSGGVACVVMSGHDVTESRAERAGQDLLAASESLFRSVIEHVPSGVLVTDRDGVLVMANGPAQEWLGLAPDAVGTPLSRWIPQAAELLAAAQSSSGRRQVDVDTPDGRRRLIGFDSVFCPLPPSGGTVIVFRDIGDYRRAERRRKRAERLAQARSLAVGLGHELQGPLAGLLAGVQFLEQEPALPANQRLVVSSLAQAARKLSRATQEFLDAARSGSLTPRLFALGKVMAEAMDPYVGHAASRQVKLEIVPANGDALLAVDLPSFRRAVGGIVASAIDAAGRDGRVHVEWRELSAEEVARRFPGFPGTIAAIRVSDGGPGLDEEELRHAFRPFGGSRTAGGGLGLAIAQEVIEAHGGLISVSSRKGEDTTFEVLLATGERMPCWQHADRPEGLCGVCPLRQSGSGYCCWSVTGYPEYAETGLWPAKCVECPVFRRYHLGAWTGAISPSA
jgi:PAS domain S-box-containing protein